MATRRAREEPEASSSDETPFETALEELEALVTRLEGGDLTLADLADRYIRHLEDIGKSRGTCFGYSMDMQVAVKHFGAGAKVAKLTPAKVKNYFEADAVVNNRAGKARAKPTIDKLRRVFRQSLMWAASEGLVPSAPVPEDYIPSGKRKKQPAS